MHLYVLIPLAAMLGASALAGGVLARGLQLRAHWALCGMLLASAGWALCEVMAGLATDPAVALAWLRATAFFGLALGPLGLVTVAELRPALRARLLGHAAWVLAVVFVLSLVVQLTPWAIESVHWRGGLAGWSYRFGPLVPLLLGTSGLVPFAAVLIFLRTRPPRSEPRDPRQRVVLLFAVVLPMSLAILTDGVLPLAGVDVPRLATLCMVALGAQFWAHSFRGDDGGASDSALARAIFDELPEGVALLEQDGRIRAVNASFARLAGGEPADLIGRQLADLAAGHVADDLADGIDEREIVLATPGGTKMPVAVSSATMRDRQGGVIGFVLVVRDQRALIAVRRRLVAAGRLAAVGELAAGIAHEVNNPIAFVHANLNELRRHRVRVQELIGETEPEEQDAAPDRSPGRTCEACIDEAQAQIGRVAQIVQEVRAFAHAGPVSLARCDLNGLVDGVLRLATLDTDRALRVDRALAEIPEVECAAQLVKQVLLGLVRRAAMAAGSSGRVVVGTRHEDGAVVVFVEDDGDPVVLGSRLDVLGDLLDLAVGDRGAFELGISHHVVREQGGELTVAASEGGGTRVELRLPAWPSELGDGEAHGATPC